MKNAIRLWGISFGVVLGIGVTALLLMALWASPAAAFNTFGSCSGCHGIFSGGDGDAVHDAHAALSNNDCGSCHNSGFALSNCVRCHGRAEDGAPSADTGKPGIGRGLRQHHQGKGVSCSGCHTDTNHAVVGSAPESVLPSFYPLALGGAGLNPCDGSEEKFPSVTVSLDNDGDGLTDAADPDCAAPPPKAPADFNGDGTSDIGVFRDGGWYLDLNGNGVWEGCGVDGCFVFGAAGQQPVVGDWTGDGQANIGVFANGGWYLDTNGNGVWEGCGVDGCSVFGAAGQQPVVGDWTGDGQIRIGVFANGGWYLDTNGNGVWEGCGTDGCFVFGAAGDQAVVGDWSGSGETSIGVFRDGSWYLDLNGNGVWDGCGVDGCFAFWAAGGQPVGGDWTGSGQIRIGIYLDGAWYLDLNGNGQWDGAGVDMYIPAFGLPGDIPAN